MPWMLISWFISSLLLLVYLKQTMVQVQMIWQITVWFVWVMCGGGKITCARTHVERERLPSVLFHFPLCSIQAVAFCNMQMRPTCFSFLLLSEFCLSSPVQSKKEPTGNPIGLQLIKKIKAHACWVNSNNDSTANERAEITIQTAGTPLSWNIKGMKKQFGGTEITRQKLQRLLEWYKK